MKTFTSETAYGECKIIFLSNGCIKYEWTLAGAPQSDSAQKFSGTPRTLRKDFHTLLRVARWENYNRKIGPQAMLETLRTGWDHWEKKQYE